VKRVAAAAVFVALCSWAAQAQDAKPARPPAAPPAPVRVNAARCGPGVIGVEAEPPRRGEPAGYVFYRAERIDGPYEEIGRRPASRPWVLDNRVQPEMFYFYKAASYAEGGGLSDQTIPTCAWDSDQLVPNGDFSLDPEGLVPSPAPPIWWLNRAYNAKTPVVIQPGGPGGKRVAEFLCSEQDVSSGLHSILIPTVEGEELRIEVWAYAQTGARVLAGLCWHGEDRKGVKGLKKPYEYVPVTITEPDGWSLHAGSLTAPKGARYAQIWALGAKARNTFRLTGIRLFDLTAQRMRGFDLEKMRRNAQGLDASPSPATRQQAKALGDLDRKIAGLRSRMEKEIGVLSPADYRLLLVELSRAQREYENSVWDLKVLGLLETDAKEEPGRK